jgi:hypothetical protein
MTSGGRIALATALFLVACGSGSGSGPSDARPGPAGGGSDTGPPISPPAEVDAGAGVDAAGRGLPAGDGGTVPPAADGGGATSDTAPDVVSGPRSICSGEDRLTFSFVRVPALASTEPGSQVVWENGAAFVRIDGHCRYWVFGSSKDASPLDEIRSGVLSAAQARQIETDLRYAEWPRLRGDYGNGILFDARPDVLSDGQSDVVCWALCSPDGPPAEMRDLFTKAMRLLDQLSASGQPASGPVRIAVHNREASSPGFSYMVWNWPLKRPLNQFVIPFGIARAGSSFLVEGADADALRALRRMERTAAAVKSGIVFIPLREGGGPLHAMYMRDTLPYEDATGLISRKP